MPYEWNPKDPDETVCYVADWTDELSGLGGDSIASYTFTISSGDATIAKQVQQAYSLKFWIAGGTSGTTTTFRNVVTTSTGQVLERFYTLLVQTDADAFMPATTTKRQLVDQAFAECGINGWEYDIDPSEKDTALTRLDMLMHELRGRGYDLNYNYPSAIGSGLLTDALGCPDQAFYGLATLLAERLAPTMGKRMSVESRMALTAARKAVYAAATNLVPGQSLGQGSPIGSGNKPWSSRYPFSMTR